MKEIKMETGKQYAHIYTHMYIYLHNYIITNILKFPNQTAAAVVVVEVAVVVAVMCI